MSWKGGELMTKGVREMDMRGGIERFLVVDEEDFKLFHGDSFKIIPYLGQFSMIFIDPPFFGWASDSKGDQKPNHNLLSYETWRRLEHGGCIFLCGTQPQLSNDWRWWKRFFTLLFEEIQAKNTGPPAINKKQPRRVHENIWCLYRTKDQFSSLKITVDRVTKPGRVKEFKGQPMKIWGTATKSKWRVGVGYPLSVFHCKRVDKNHPEYVGHPTQKPEKLLELFIRMSTEEGDWILDPFAGSGAVSTVARRLGRNSIAIEIEDKWIDVIKKRVRVEKYRTSITEFTDESITDEEFEEMQEKIALTPASRKTRMDEFFKRDEP